MSGYNSVFILDYKREEPFVITNAFTSSFVLSDFGDTTTIGDLDGMTLGDYDDKPLIDM